MKYKAIIFDFGGVMHTLEGISAKSGIIAALKKDNQVEEEVLLTLYSEYANKLGSGEVTELEFWQQICSQLRIPVPQNYKELWRSDIRENAKAFEEMFYVIEELKRNSLKTIVLSNTVEPHAEVLREKGWYKSFDKVFLSHEVKMRKPDKQIFEYVLNKLNLAPQEIVFVDDLEENIVAAQSLHISSIHAKNPQQVIGELEKLLQLKLTHR